MLLIAKLLSLGAGVGLISSFFGVGGGVLIVPTIYFIFESIAPSVVIGSSLMVICLNSVINVYNFKKTNKKLNYKFTAFVGIPAIIGVFVATKITFLLTSSEIKKIFACVLCVIIIRVLWATKKHHQSAKELPRLTRRYLFLCGFGGFLGGIVSGLTGLGGGAVLVPLFISVLKVPYGLISFYSNACMFLITGFGSLTYIFSSNIPSSFSLSQYQWGHVNYAIVLGIFAGSFITSKLGIKLDMNVKSTTKQILFACLLSFMALKMFLA